MIVYRYIMIMCVCVLVFILNVSWSLISSLQSDPYYYFIIESIESDPKFMAPISVVGNRKLNFAHANYYFRFALDSPEDCLEISQIIELMRIYSQHKFVTCANEKGSEHTMRMHQASRLGNH